jgi:DNA-binding YbaB/EbfC family protein
MFDALKGLGNLGGILAKANEMKAKMKEVQDGLANKRASADAGGGMVEATVNGRLELVKVRIDKARIDVNDTELLEDMIVAAVHGAQVKAADMAKDEMAKVASDLGLPPGLLPT